MSNPPSAPCGATGANPPVADLANVPKMWGRRQISQMSHLSRLKKCDISRHSRHLACPIFRAKPEARQPAASVSLPVPLIYCSTVLARPWRAGGAAHLKKPHQTTPNHAKSRHSSRLLWDSAPNLGVFARAAAGRSGNPTVLRTSMDVSFRPKTQRALHFVSFCIICSAPVSLQLFERNRIAKILGVPH
jgi:hypothetical protein